MQKPKHKQTWHTRFKKCTKIGLLMNNLSLSSRLVNLPFEICFEDRVWVGIDDSKRPRTASDRICCWSNRQQLSTWQEITNANAWNGDHWEAVGLAIQGWMGLSYLDFDNVRNPLSGEITEETSLILERLANSTPERLLPYTEISQSLTGIHVLAFARGMRNGSYLLKEAISNSKPARLEIFTNRRIAALTGRAFGNASSWNSSARCGEGLRQILKELQPSPCCGFGLGIGTGIWAGTGLHAATDQGHSGDITTTTACTGGSGSPDWGNIDAIPEGGRNSSLARFAWQLLSRGVESWRIEDVLLEENLRICLPPLNEREVRSISKSIINSYRRKELAYIGLSESDNLLDDSFDNGAIICGTNQPSENSSHKHCDEVTEPAPAKDLFMSALEDEENRFQEGLIESIRNPIQAPISDESSEKAAIQQTARKSRTKRRQQQRDDEKRLVKEIRRSQNSTLENSDCYQKHNVLLSDGRTVYKPNDCNKLCSRHVVNSERYKIVSRSSRNLMRRIFGRKKLSICAPTVYGKIDNKIVGMRLICNNWSCQRCGPVRRAMWVFSFSEDVSEFKSLFYQVFTEAEWEIVKDKGRQHLKLIDGLYRWFLTTRGVEVISSTQFHPGASQNLKKIKNDKFQDLIFDVLCNIRLKRMKHEHLVGGSRAWRCPEIGSEPSKDYTYLGIGLDPDKAHKMLTTSKIASILDNREIADPPAGTPDVVPGKEYHEVEQWHWGITVPFKDEMEANRIKVILQIRKTHGKITTTQPQPPFPGGHPRHLHGHPPETEPQEQNGREAG